MSAKRLRGDGILADNRVYRGEVTQHFVNDHLLNGWVAPAAMLLPDG